jgi:hypothetical protein
MDGEADVTGLPQEDSWHLIHRQDGIVLRLDYQASATPEQIAQGDATASTFDLRTYQTRPLHEIYTDVSALTGPQKTNVWTDLSAGHPPKYLLDEGPNAAAIMALDWSASDSGATGNAAASAKQRIITMFCQDCPSYLVYPPFDQSINVPGGVPVP